MRRGALCRRTLLKGLLGKKRLARSQLLKTALLKMVCREVLSAAPVEAAKTRVRRVVLRAVALKLAQARDIADKAAAGKPVMLSAPLSRVALRATLAKATLARRAAVRGAPGNPALVRAAAARDAMDRVAAPKPVTLRVPALLALPGVELLALSSKIRVNRRKAPPVNAALMRLVRVPRARNRRHPNGVVHQLIALRGRRASQWTRHLKPP